MTESPRLARDPQAWLIALLFTLAFALAINPYYFGLDDNSITIPLLKASVNPALYPGDYLIAQRPFYYTVLWDVLGQIHAHLGIGLPPLFFAVYLIALYFTFLGLYRLALVLFESREVAILSLVFLMFAKRTLGGVYTVETMLSTREVVIPILLFAWCDFLERRVLRSFVLLGLAYLVHPLTAHYLLAIFLVVSVVDRGRVPWRSLAAGFAVFLLIASPLLLQKLRHSPPSLHLFSADPQWVSALRARSAHHMFPFTWGRNMLVRAIVTVGLFAIAWRYRGREREDRHRVMILAVWTILAILAAGIIGSELVPMGLVFMTQPARAFQLMTYITMIYVAHDLYRRTGGPGATMAAIGVGLLYAIVTLAMRPGVLEIAVLVAIAALMIVFGRRRGTWLAGRAFAACAAAVIVIPAAVTLANQVRTDDVEFSMGADESPFIEVQDWARTHTDVRDGFIVPPYESEEFRVFSERTHYGDIEDGGLMNGNPEFGLEWVRRMKMLGLERPSYASIEDPRSRTQFMALDATRLRRIASEMKPASRQVLLVWPIRGGALPFAPVYRNQAYVVYRID